eukprot:3335456-Prymnesium_polylepis.1
MTRSCSVSELRGSQKPSASLGAVCTDRLGSAYSVGARNHSRALQPPAPIEALVEALARARLTAHGVAGRVDVVPRVNGPLIPLSDARIVEGDRLGRRQDHI